MSALADWGNYGCADGPGFHLCGFTWRLDPPTDETFSVAPHIPLTGDTETGAGADSSGMDGNAGNGNGRGATAPQSLADADGPAAVSVSSVCGPDTTAETLSPSAPVSLLASALACVYCGAPDGRTRAGALSCWTCAELADAERVA